MQICYLLKTSDFLVKLKLGTQINHRKIKPIHSAVCLQHVPVYLPSLPLAEAITMQLQAREKKLPLQAYSPLPFIALNKASLLIQRGKRGERKNWKRAEKVGVQAWGGGEQKSKSKQFWVSSHFSLRTEEWGKKKSIMEHTWILFRAPSHPLANRPLENQITQQTYRLL